MKTVTLQRMTRRLVIAAMSAAALPAVAASDEMPVDVGMVRLLACPEKFDGKVVRVVGFLAWEFEADSLYLHREDLENGTGNVLWIHRPEKADEKLSGHYVQVIGTFDAKDTGHMGLYPAAITKVTKITDIGTIREQMKAMNECTIPATELSAEERKLVGSWEQNLSGERRVETFESDRTHWVVSIGPLGETTLLRSSRWWIKNGDLLFCDIHQAPAEIYGPRKYGIGIDDIGAEKFSLLHGSLTYKKCDRPTKPSKSDLILVR